MAKQISCLSNIRQVGIAFTMYTNANKGVFPGPAERFPLAAFAWDWIYFRPEQGPLTDSAIAPYLFQEGFTGIPQILVCPSDDVTNRPGTFNNEVYPFSYTMNATVAGVYTNYLQPLNVTQISNPSEKLLLIEETEASLNDGDWWPFGYDILSVRHGQDSRVQADSFGNDDDHRGNAAFVDGHAEFVPRSYVQTPAHYDATLP